MFAMLFEWNWEEAKREFERALEINPGYIQGAGWYYVHYQGHLCGRFDDALRGTKECWASDPLSGYATTMVGATLGTFFHDREVLDWCERAEALDPAAFLTRWIRVQAHMSLGEWDEAIAAVPALLERWAGTALSVPMEGLSRQAKGDLNAARATYDESTARSVHEYVAPMSLAALAAAIGDREAASRHLQDAVRRRDPLIVLCAHGWSGMEPLQALPEYQAILCDIGLTEWAERGG